MSQCLAQLVYSSRRHLRVPISLLFVPHRFPHTLNARLLTKGSALSRSDSPRFMVSDDESSPSTPLNPTQERADRVALRTSIKRGGFQGEASDLRWKRK
ncbi:hypothetical protein CDAR_126181 [Caerostris darwini]|uniref:Uncharacterized protein n=1 Tax=Caerostris darwini TaxID=1538125 RepID=A0AAV4S7W8_9ARAC|nr:hypothetical protein CDAR_126181 [Caerostris darwini]